MPQRRYPEAEYTRTEGSPLPPQRLAAIWRTLQESERFGFILSLDEQIADKVIELTAPAHQPATERNLT
jgi:hypothetical protein